MNISDVLELLTLVLVIAVLCLVPPLVLWIRRRVSDNKKEIIGARRLSFNTGSATGAQVRLVTPYGVVVKFPGDTVTLSLIPWHRIPLLQFNEEDDILGVVLPEEQVSW